MFIKMHGNQGDERWTIDQINGLPWYDEGAWLRLLYEPRVRTNQDLKLGVFVSAAKAAATGPRHDKTITLLRQALGIDPHNLVVNCKLAEAFERIGSGQEAISAYESALKDLRKTPCLKKYVSSQIKRVKANGPRR
jgi:tetratricopeptide (TPR) repeat protein